MASQTAAVSGGRWNAALPAQSGSFDEYSLEAKAGSVVRTVENLVFGEVWIAGGQSNMEWTLAKAAEAADWAKKEHTGKVRFFVSVDSGSDTPQDDVAGYWLTAVSWDAAQLCSAIGYMFAYNLSDTLGIPVGIVNTAQGGSRFCTWIGQDTTAANPDFADYVTAQIQPRADDGTWDALHRFYNSRIHPMRGYQAAGILWYQGETDIERGNGGRAAAGDTFVGKGLEHRFRRRREPPALPVGADRLLQLSERLPSGDRLYRRSQRDGRAQRQFPHESGGRGD